MDGSVYCAWRIPAHLGCTPSSIMLHYGYQIPNVYLFMADIVNPDLLCVFVGPGSV